MKFFHFSASLSGADHMGSVPTTRYHHDVNEANAALVAFRYVLRLEWRESLSKLTFTNFSLEVLLFPPHISYGQLFL